jgi:diacylglycerol kinase (ATP)
MRAAAILGLGCSPKNLKPFQSGSSIEWCMGMPASANEADVILLFGGDGTIHRHLGQLVRLGLPVLVVPAGSGNDFARALRLVRVRDSLMAWRRFCAGADNLRRVDLGVISAVEIAGGSPVPHGPWYFCSVASIGLDAEVARRANRLARWVRGHGGYLLSLAPAIFTFAPVPMKILTPVEDAAGGNKGGNNNDHCWTTRSAQSTLLAAFANTPSYGGGMRIAPHAKMDDGLLDVCIVGSIDPFKLFCMFPTIYGGQHLKIKKVEYFQTGRVRVETEHPLDVYADGEYVCPTPIKVAVQRAALTVVTL